MDLIPWNEWVVSNTIIPNAEPMQLACPKCGNQIYKRTDIILSCYPPKHQYFCSECDWVGFA